MKHILRFFLAILMLVGFFGLQAVSESENLGELETVGIIAGILFFLLLVGNVINKTKFSKSILK